MTGSPERTISARPTPGGAELRVAWIGARPVWAGGEVERDGLTIHWAGDTLGATELPPQVVHAVPGGFEAAAEARLAIRSSRLVCDLGGHGATLDESTARTLAAADVVLVDSEWERSRVATRFGQLAERLQVVPSPLELDWYAPEPALLKSRGPEIKRFRRLHRLAHPTVLFVGPYTESGGLHLALESAYRLRERHEALRLAAIPLGEIDSKYLDRCEAQALGLGHRGIVEWSVTGGDVPFWYATATVVCAPWRTAGPPEPARLAAAAGRPFVGSDAGAFRDELGADGVVVTAGSVDELERALDALIADTERASELDSIGRARAERELGSEAALRRLRDLWGGLAGEGAGLPSTNGSPRRD